MPAAPCEKPVSGRSFDQGKIVVTGRAEDDIKIAKVEVAIVNAAGQYMSSTGTFTSTTESWRGAFLNSPGSPASNYSYTTPVITSGTYTVHVRATDHHNQVSALRTSTGIAVTQPGNTAPVAKATVSCKANVCTFDGRTSTDENASALTYAWTYGNSTTGVSQGTGTGPVPVKTFTAAGTYNVLLTVTDEWKATGTTTVPVTVTEPSGNVAPTPTFKTSCLALTCSVSSTGTVDSNTGDVITYSWNWGDGTPPSSGATPVAHRYAQAGEYTITLTATDGWGRSASTTRVVTRTEPVDNAAPTAAFSSACSGLVCQMNSNATSDPNGDQLIYSWAWGDNTAGGTTANPSHTYAGAGTYTITLTVRDGWDKVGTTTRRVTLP